MDYSVHLNGNNLSFCADESKTILDTALEKQFHLGYSCKKGECGSCSASLLSGVVKDMNGNSIDSGNILTCCSFPQSDITLDVDFFPELQDISVLNLPCKIINLEFLFDKFYVLKVKLPPNARFNFLPGQYVNLSLKGVVRSYSLASADVQNDVLEFHIKHVSNGKFSTLLALSQINQLMRLEGPLGTFFIRHSAAPIIFVAGGTGFAPIQCMIQELIQEENHRLVYCYWRMKSSQDFYSTIPFGWVNKNIKFIPFVSKEDINALERKGDIDEILKQDFESLHGFHVYVCGSLSLIQKTKDICSHLGLDSKSFFTDAFVSSGD
ncbi:MAG: CDP-6-deoxy-delta-3,4-glucoseen reductase [Gammaproteobacteria bacterium]|nr:CDP-6-deoxy-delta-3,4-glucoseen reductase [Gammaproteobacteria bacterium]